MTSPSTDQFTGLYATPELVGRKDILAKFERILRDPSTAPRLVFLHGVGGIGKTRLLQKILDMARRLENCRAAEDVIDFYHIGLHMPIGLTQGIYKVLTPPFDSFEAYSLAYDKLNHARVVGNVVELEELRDDAVHKFDQNLNRLSSAKRVVLALDTAERVVYGLSDWMNEIPFAESWDWLIEHLQYWQNIIVFVAGRDESIPAIEQVKKRSSILVDDFSIDSLNLEAGLEYFDEVARLAEINANSWLAERLRNLNRDFKIGTHFYSRGRPILLSLFVDYLSFPSESTVPDLLRQPLPKAVNEETYQHFEEILFERLQQSEIGETLVALGRVPKGADVELVTALLGISRSDAQKRLDDVKKLSVVKIRPEDQRIFLHDEMYDLLYRHVYNSPYDAKRDSAFNVIKKYYQDKRDICIEHLAELYAPVEKGERESLSIELINDVYTERQTILSEMMFYFLRQDFARGFRHYYRYSQEAIYSNDVLMDMHLHAEMLSFLVRLPKGDQKRVEAEFDPQILLTMLQIRPVLRKWAESNFVEAINVSSRLLEKVGGDWEKSCPSILVALHVWKAYGHVMRSERDDIVKSDAHLNKAFSLIPETIRQALKSPEEIAAESNGKYSVTEVWLFVALLSLAYRVYGYLFRIRGYSQQAIENYRAAIERLNFLDIWVEKATALNDIGFALATQGKWQSGRSLTRDALDLRLKLGHRLPVAFSMNTLAMIDIYEGQYAAAQNNAERSLAIFHARSDARGRGLALIALSESQRRYATADPVLDPEKRIELIRQARDHAEEARSIFSQKVKEVPRLVQAFIELGCAYRDWARLRTEYPNPKDSPSRLSAEAEEKIKKACDLAKDENLKYLEIDAFVNLAWLRYYILSKNELIGANHSLTEEIDKAHQSIPNEYWFVASRQPSVALADAQIEIWPQIGKLLLLEGHIEYHKFDMIAKDEKKKFAEGANNKLIIDILEGLAQKYADSLEYSALYAKDFRGIRGARDQIYEKFKGLNASERRVICKKIREHYLEGDSLIEELLRDRVLWID